MNRLIIIGASGHGKVVADIAKLNGYTDIVILDNDSNIKSCAGFPVLGPDSILSDFDGDVFVAVGNAVIRETLMKRAADRNMPVLIHPNSVIADSVTIGNGSVIMAGSVINPDVSIGKGVIVNTCSSIDHDCVIGDYCHIAVGAHLCGTVRIGDSTWVGAGATIINNISICSNSMIGAGAVVVNDILVPGIYLGVPARRKEME